MFHLEIQACSNISESVDVAQSLPRQVFRSRWATYLMFDAGWLGVGRSEAILRMFLEAGRDSLICGQTLDVPDQGVVLLRVASPEGTWGIFLDRTEVSLRAGRLACAPDTGDWCIYCDFRAEIGILALKTVDLQKLYTHPIHEIGARAIEDALATPHTWAFSHIRPEWAEALQLNYGRGKT